MLVGAPGMEWLAGEHRWEFRSREHELSRAQAGKRPGADRGKGVAVEQPASLDRPG